MKFEALKERDSAAQGNALGFVSAVGQALKGRNSCESVAPSGRIDFPSVTQGCALGFRIVSRWDSKKRSL